MAENCGCWTPNSLAARKHNSRLHHTLHFWVESKKIYIVCSKVRITVFSPSLPPPMPSLILKGTPSRDISHTNSRCTDLALSQQRAQPSKLAYLLTLKYPETFTVCCVCQSIKPESILIMYHQGQFPVWEENPLEWAAAPSPIVHKRWGQECSRTPRPKECITCSMCAKGLHHGLFIAWLLSPLYRGGPGL